MHNFLMQISEFMPCKTIQINDENYLQRYYAGEDQDGTQHWLHRFLRNDSERHLHSHPWTATSHILAGQYTEQRSIGLVDYLAGSTNIITPDTIHRIVATLPNTWTLMVVKPERLGEWFFIDEDGNKKMMQSSPVDWWKTCLTRDGKMPITHHDLAATLQEIADLRARKEAA